MLRGVIRVQANRWLKRKERRGEGLAGDHDGEGEDNVDQGEGDDEDPVRTVELLKLTSMLAGLNAEALEMLAADAVQVELAAEEVQVPPGCHPVVRSARSLSRPR